jgi:hypothetical protein
LHSKYLKIKAYRNFPVLNGYEAVISRVGHRLRVFEKRVLKNIFGPKE